MIITTESYLSPRAQSVRNLPTMKEDQGSIAGLERSPGEGNGNPLQYSCLGNLMDRGAWQARLRSCKCRTQLRD